MRFCKRQGPTTLPSRTSRIIWDVQEYLDSLRVWGLIAETPADRAIPRVPPPPGYKKGESPLDFLYNLAQLMEYREAMKDTVVK